MKIISFVLMVCCVSIMGFANINDNVVVLQYDKDINGLHIEVLWKPKYSKNGFVEGPAIIQLTNIKEGGVSTLTNNNFAFPKERTKKFIKLKNYESTSSVIESITNNVVSLEYTYPKVKTNECDFGTDEEPFFFYDVDFDGQKELLIVEIGKGQRWRNTFKAYKIVEDQVYDVLEDDFHQITYKEPFVFFDSASTVNAETETIEINWSCGARHSFTDIYIKEFDPSAYDFVFKKIK